MLLELKYRLGLDPPSKIGRAYIKMDKYGKGGQMIVDLEFGQVH